MCGHTHRPGVWPAGGVTVINTGSFCPPLGGYVADVAGELLVVREVTLRSAEFRLGRTIAEIPLAPR